MSAQTLRGIYSQLAQIMVDIDAVATTLEQAQANAQPNEEPKQEENVQKYDTMGGKAKKASKPRKAASSVASKAPAKKKK